VKFVCHSHTELKLPVNLTTYPTIDHRNYDTDRWLSCFHFTTQSTTVTNEVPMRGQLSIISAKFLLLPTSPLTETKTDLHLLYAFFWVIPRRLNFIYRRFGTLRLFHLHGQAGMTVKLKQSVPKRRHIKFRRRGITQKKAYNIQNAAEV